MSTREPRLGSFTPRSGDYKDHLVVVHGGLHMIRGNRTPYFSLTCDIYDSRMRDVGGGAAHDLILHGMPELKPLADLHLSDIDGVPSHGSSNAWYWMAGAASEFADRVRFHGGNGTPKRSPDECLRIFAEHVRIPLDEAVTLREMLRTYYRNIASFYSRTYENGGIAETQAMLAQWCEAQRPRWKREADECIAKLHLKIFGDHYSGSSEVKRHN